MELAFAEKKRFSKLVSDFQENEFLSGKLMLTKGVILNCNSYSLGNYF